MHEMHPQLQSIYCAKSDCMQIATNEDDMRAHWDAKHTKCVFQCSECFKIFEKEEFVNNHLAVSHVKTKIQLNQ